MAVAGSSGRVSVASGVRCALAFGVIAPLAVAIPTTPAVALVNEPNVVTTTVDVIANDGACSLREALVAANTGSGATAPAGECTDGRLRVELEADATYVITAGALPAAITNLTLNGNGATIESQVTGRVLETGTGPDSNDVELNDLIVTHRSSVTGVVGRGLYLRGNANLTNVRVRDNEEAGPGGGIYAEGTTTITGSHVQDNSTGTNTGTRDGGGIYNTATGDLTISGGTVSGNFAERDGGGIANFGSIEIIATNIVSNDTARFGGGLLNTGDAVLLGMSLTSNEAVGPGGGLYNSSTGVVTMTNGRISNNEGDAGGGVFNSGELTIDNVTVIGNRSTTTALLGGGGIYSSGTPTEISGVVIFGNTSQTSGGGIKGASLTLRDSSVFGNESGESGGGLDVVSSTLERVTIHDNTAGGFGGGIIAGDSSITASTISGNTAVRSGGGIYLSSESAILNSTVSGNSAEDAGGGINSIYGTTIRFSTITDNTAPGGAGVRHLPKDGTIGTTLTASIIAGNHGGLDIELDPSPGPQPDGNVNSLGYNVIGSVGTGVDGFVADGDLVDADARLDPLADNGGPTLTHQPQPDSPALDRVPSGAPEIVPDEQRGLLRRPLGDGADSGAIECCESPFFSRTPTRIVDTREGGETVDGEFAGDGPIEGDTIAEIQVGGRVPGSIVGSVVMNVTTVDSTGNGFLTIFDCEEQPLASSLNYSPGRTANNEVIAELDDAGRVCIYAKTTTHVVIDVVAGSVLRPGNSSLGQRMRYRPITPARLLETRSGDGLETIDGEFQGGGAIDGDTELELQITGRNSIVHPDATAVVVNLSTVGSLGNGFLTVYDCENRPLASGINYSTDGVVNNEIVTSLSPSGTICIYAKTTTHVVVDAVGYLLPGSGYRAVTPARVLETRPGLTTVDGEFEGGGAIASDTMIEVQIGGRGGVTVDAAQATVNVSALTGVGNGFLTIWDCGDRPLASAINYGPGRVVNNEVIVGLSDEGTICIYAKTTAQVIVDVVGFSNAQLGAA